MPVITQDKNGENVVVGVFVATKAMDYIVQNLAFFRSVQIIGLLLIYIAAITAAILYSGRFLRPLKSLSDSVANVTEGVEEKITVSEDYAEVQEMRERLQAFMEKMTVIDESRQEFVSNVSHELKTPLTSMKVLADSLNGQEDVPVELYLGIYAGYRRGNRT